MSKATSYLVIAVVAFLVGGFSFQIVNHASESKAESKSGEGRANGGGATAAVPREFVIEGMSCQGCADTITSALTKIPDVQSASVSLQNNKAIVVAKESQVPSDKILAAIIAVGYKGQLALAEQNPPTTTTITSGKQPILVNITRGKNDVHAVSMALGLAQSAIKDGRTAIVFLNVEAPVFAAKDLDNDLKCADFPPVKKMLADFIAMEGRLLICRHCAHVVKLSKEDTLDGVKVVSHEELFEAMPPGTVVFSY
jgi:copper chaperone CopZ/predicted peroxiredoxin